jgi:hypothetical protein
MISLDLEAIPKLELDHCYLCGAKFDENVPRSPWRQFAEVDGVMHTVPQCQHCCIQAEIALKYSTKCKECDRTLLPRHIQYCSECGAENPNFEKVVH